ncbi:hypothetical protein ACOMHN_029993 [Nucella lapillus]
MSPAGPGLNPPPQGISPDTRSWLPPTPAGQCAQQLMNLALQLMSTRDQRPAMGWGPQHLLAATARGPQHLLAATATSASSNGNSKENWRYR